MNADSFRAEAFHYLGFDVDADDDRVRCRYALDELEFVEEFRFPGGGDWSAPAVAEMVRLLFLLAGVSYYKAAAPPVVDFGETALTATELDFVQEFYRHGLGEFAYRNGLDLSGTSFAAVPLTRATPAPYAPVAGRPLIPFGGGVDSIVSVELLRGQATEPALFVVNRPGDRFAAIEEPAVVTGYPVVRAERLMDSKILRSRELGFLNGHVPVTGVISATALVAAALEGRDAVVMSNEWSASSATLKVGDREINHQYSKSEAFETGLQKVVQEATGGAPQYFSLLRPFTELWIAERFAQLSQYFGTFRSCNRAFLIDPARRAQQWCGDCDKCAFIDLILAPFVPAGQLRAIFGGREPLERPEQLPQFRTLLALTPDAKPWECVGDEAECRVAARLALARPDRTGNPVLSELVREADVFTDPSTDELLRPVGHHAVPARYAPADLAR
ncbi:endonuclease domain-containing protein [Spongisporangium articulatum]|uniref:UDP-N-acetyl-alpha-D-muramoyl-L-alanyl-L-glutamate epimerase n=1 Tax=Spongisporangium articulatum TaxID=3362603 RepID=A0ABW8AJR9_9ACTN